MGIEALECRALLSASASFSVVNDWGSGFQGAITVTNGPTAASNWQLEFDFARHISDIWDARIVSHTGSRYVIENEAWNGALGAGQSVTFGFVASPGNVTDGPTNYALNGVSLGPPAELPTISIADAVALEPLPGVGAKSGFLHTSGNQILDAANQPVKIAGVNWFGLETDTFSPHGLWARNWKSMLDQIAAEGFNTIRLPYSNQLFDAGSTPNGINFSLNPDLVGVSGLGIIDKIVGYAGEIGLRILLDRHRSNAGSSANENGLWYTAAYPESRWIADWVMLAQRYAGNPTVIGADLHNEPHGPANWGQGGVNDWRLAAERAGNAILAVNPDWLIVVEGVQDGVSGSYWWGGNLSNAAAAPVRLNVPGKLVYSPHSYPASVWPQSWFNDPAYPDNLPEVWDRNWGYLFREGVAPLLLGEFGSRLTAVSDQQWFEKMVAYLGGDLNGNGQSDLAAGQLGISWTYWSWNPNSSDTGGILQDNWQTVHRNKVDGLASIQFDFPELPAGSAHPASITVTLSAPSSQTVTVAYATANQSAVAGVDYLATSGVLTFAPGETQRTIDIPIVGDGVAEPTKTLRVVLSAPVNATLANSFGTVSILDSEGPLGDANGDGIVDGADYTIWADRYATSTILGRFHGDFNRDGVVDGADYTIWADRYAPAATGTTAATASAAALPTVPADDVINSPLQGATESHPLRAARRTLAAPRDSSLRFAAAVDALLAALVLDDAATTHRTARGGDWLWATRR